MSKTKEIYISVDIEADGPIPGAYSMLSLGAAACNEQEIISTFSVNFELLDGASQHPSTMEWWKQYHTAYYHTRENVQTPQDGMSQFENWITSVLPSKKVRPVFVAFPAGFDFTFVYWYFIKFLGHSPFAFVALDMKSYAMAKLGKKFSNCKKSHFPAEWFSKENKHTHIALDDAIEQAHIFLKMLQYKQNKEQGQECK